jgi:hypothetical protein
MSEPRKFKHWVYLNEEGKKLYGHIFPGGEIPVVSMVPMWGGIEGQAEKLYLIYHEELSEQQVYSLLTLLSERFKAPKEAIKKQMLSERIPIRDKYTSGAGTNHPGFFT